MSATQRDRFEDLPVLGELRDLLERRFVASAPRQSRVRWLRRRSRPVLVIGVLLVAGGSAAAAVSLLGKPSAPLTGTVPDTTSRSGQSRSQAVVPEAGGHYRVTVSPSLGGGTAGWTSIVTITAKGRHPDGGGIAGGYPTRAAPLFETLVRSFGPDTNHLQGDLVDYVLTGPEVAAVKVGATTIATASNRNLPAGDRIAVFFVPANSPPIVIAPPGARLPYYERFPAFPPTPKTPTAPTQTGSGSGGVAFAPARATNPNLAAQDRALLRTLEHAQYRRVLTTAILPLDQSGHVIATTASPTSYARHIRWWHSPTPTPTGPCELVAAGLPGLTPEWGHVATALEPVSDAQGELFLSCIDTEYTLDHWPLDAAILLDAHHPGQPLGRLPGAKPVPAHPGVVNITLGSTPGDITARRVGNAWLAVQGGRNLAQRLRVLTALRIARLAIPHG